MTEINRAGIVSDVVISDRLSDANPVRLLGVSNLAVSWELSAPGSLAFDMPLVDLIRYGFRNPITLKGRWIRYEHPTLGPWGGIITGVNLSNGIISITAESWAIALDGVGTRIWGDAQYGAVSMLMQQIDRVKHLTGITPGVTDVGGSDLVIKDQPITPGTDLLNSYIPQVLELWQTERGYQQGLRPAGWNVDPTTRRLNFDGTYGTDRTGSVWVHAGRHVAHTEIGDDLSDIVNTVFYDGDVNYRFTESPKGRRGKGKQREKAKQHTGVKHVSKIGFNASSVAQYGERGMQLNDDFPNEDKMQQAANRRASYLGLDTQNVSIDCADVDSIWSRFREGDLITAVLGFDGLIGPMVVRMRSFDANSGILTLAGEATLGPVLT